MGPEPIEGVASGAAVSVADRSSTSEKSNLAPVRAIDTARVRAAASSQVPPHYHHHLATRTARWTSSSYSRRCSCGAMSAHVGRYPAKPLSSRHQTTPPPPQFKPTPSQGMAEIVTRYDKNNVGSLGASEFQVRVPDRPRPLSVPNQHLIGSDVARGQVRCQSRNQHHRIRRTRGQVRCQSRSTSE